MSSDRWNVRFRRGLLRFFEGGVKRRPVFRYWHELEASQWWSRERLDALRLERLQHLMNHAQATCPWYKESWRADGLDARELRTMDDFARWPVIDREIIRVHRDAMRTTVRKIRLIPKATGGSSGVPLQFDLDTNSNERRMAAWHRGYQWAGAGPGTKQWYLWGVPPASAGEWKLRKLRLYDRLYHRTTMSCFNLGEATLGRFLVSLNRTRPDAIVAYSNALYAFAQMLDERHLVPWAPNGIVVGAEALFPFQRKLIERVFRAPVFETYGSREFMLMGAECSEHDGLHLTEENLLVEVVDDSGIPVDFGIEGNVVVTDFTNFGMPFIRYANGDRAVMGTGVCACGRRLARLARVAGRQLDVLTTPDGRRLPGEFFPHILKELSSIRRFQVVQEVPNAVTIRLVAPSWTPADENWLRHEVAVAAGGELEVRLELVDDISLTTAGKLRVVINKLASGMSLGEEK